MRRTPDELIFELEQKKNKLNDRLKNTENSDAKNKILKRISQFDARVQDIKARAKNSNNSQYRKDDARRKIMFGAFMFTKLESSPTVRGHYDEFLNSLTKDHDIELFANNVLK